MIAEYCFFFRQSSSLRDCSIRLFRGILFAYAVLFLFAHDSFKETSRAIAEYVAPYWIPEYLAMFIGTIYSRFWRLQLRQTSDEAEEAQGLLNAQINEND
jgi:hypothetical protein